MVRAQRSVYAEKRIPDVRRSGIPSYASGIYSKDRRDETESFFFPKRIKCQAMSADKKLCTALKGAKIDELALALKNR